eukprot:12400030-Alexandrium_andersonii.AAC.1
MATTCLCLRGQRGGWRVGRRYPGGGPTLVFGQLEEFTPSGRVLFPPGPAVCAGGGPDPGRTGAPPQVVFSGMAHVAAADPRADDLAVPVIAADASGQDLLVGAVHDVQEEQ